MRRPERKLGSLMFLLAAAVMVGIIFSRRSHMMRAARTADYITALDVAAIESRGADFTGPRYDPARLGKPLERLDPDYDYDFEASAEAEARLRDVDRRAVLARIFDQVTIGATSNADRHVAVLRFLQRAVADASPLRPMHADGNLVTDPLLLLELNEMDAAQAARLAVDLFEAGGMTARCVDLGHHTVAEVFYDDGWHLFDAVALGGDGLTVRNDDGSVPSLSELSRRPELLDALPYRFDLRPAGRPRQSGSLACSSVYFPSERRRAPRCITKEPGTYTGDRHYGWRGTTDAPIDWKPPIAPARHQPGVPRLTRVEVESDTQPPAALITWAPARDEDRDLLGYRVFVATASRGWHYDDFDGARSARPFWNGASGWEPGMYEALHRLPPHDVVLITTREPSVRLDLDPERPYFVTVMAFDDYHERIGKTLYLMSNELRIGGPTRSKRPPAD